MAQYQYDIQEVAMSLISVNRFYATILSKIVKIPTKTLPTAGVGFNKLGKLTLYYNEKWLLSMPLEQSQAVIIHEVLHIFFRHLTRFPKDGENEHLDNLKNMACDIAINQYINNLPTDPECLLPEQFDLEKEKNADFYLEELKKKFKDQKEMANHFCPSKDENGDSPCQKGQKCPNQSPDGQGKPCPNSMDDHSVWGKVVDEKTGEVIDASTLDIDPEYEVQSTVMRSIEECKDFGNLPAFVKKEIEILKTVVRFNWKHELKVFVNSVLSVAKRLSQKRVNRRFMGDAFFLPGKKKARRPRLLLARDTSGSCYAEEIQKEFLNEMISISKFCEVFVSDCDTKVHQTYKVKSIKDFKEYQGGGGTAFEPVFEEAKKIGVDGIIYLTDTYGSFPDKGDIGKFASKTIWVTINETKVSVPFGKHVNIDPNMK